MNLLYDIPSRENKTDHVNVVIEVVSGSRDKYEYVPKWESFVLDRVLHSSVVFPVEYGFIPQTWYDDDDPLDIMVLSYEPLEVGCIVRTKVIGALIMEDEKGEDSKILAVPISDPRFKGYKDLNDVHPHRLIEIQDFFEIYKRLEPHKWVKFNKWQNAQHANEIINYSINKFKEFKLKKAHLH